MSLSRNVDLRLGRFAQTDQMHVRNYSNNLAHRRLARIDRSVWNDAFANRIFAREKMFREPFGNNRDRRCGPLIMIGERAPPPDWDTHGLEVIGSDDVHLRHGLLPRRDRTFLNIEIETDFAAAQW